MKDKPPQSRTTTIEKCETWDGVYTESLGDRVIRLYVGEKVYELGQLVEAKNCWQTPNGAKGFIVELSMPFTNGKTDHVIKVMFYDHGMNIVKPTELAKKLSPPRPQR